MTDFSTSYHYGRMDAQYHLAQHDMPAGVMALTARCQSKVCADKQERAYWLGVAREARK